MQKDRRLPLFLDAPNVKRFDTRFVFEVVKLSLSLPVGPMPGKGGSKHR